MSKKSGCPPGTKITKSEKCRFKREIPINKSRMNGRIYYEATANSYIDSKGDMWLPVDFRTGELDVVRYTKTVSPKVAQAIKKARRR